MHEPQNCLFMTALFHFSFSCKGYGLLVVLVLAAFLLSACGAGGGTNTPSPASAAAGSSGLESSNTNSDSPVLLTSANESGISGTWVMSGTIDSSHPFFKASGNGRSCATCHQPNDGWSITPAGVQARFAQTQGLDPLFKPHDGANSPLADVSNVDARRAAYSMLLTKGLIRMGLPLPKGAEFELVAADDPYGYAGANELSLFRRPMSAANVAFLTSVMWDGRETHADSASGTCIKGTTDCYQPLDFNLEAQARHAVAAHAQAAAGLTQSELSTIVQFEKGLFTAQLSDANAGSLSGAGAGGGPQALASTLFYFGINDNEAGDYRTNAPFKSSASTVYDAWSGAGPLADPGAAPEEAARQTAARQAIARGQTLFNNAQIFINNVPGMKNASVRGTCTTCHNAPNIGSHSTPVMFNLGLSDAARRTSDLPLYTLRNKASGEVIQTTDPGAAMASGKWEDIGRFKVPVLRGLASRAPYFHNGSARDLTEVVNFYNERFKIGFDQQDVADLVAYLKAL